VAGVQVAIAQRDAAQAELELLLAGSKPEQITLAEIGISQAEAARDEAALAVSQAETAVTQASCRRHPGRNRPGLGPDRPRPADFDRTVCRQNRPY
jgi:hypothetical protein